MDANKTPYSLYLPVKLGCVKLFVFIDENIRKCTSAPHSHHFYELRYIKYGRPTQVIDGTSYDWQSGDFILIKPGEYHYQDKIPENGRWSQYSLRFELCDLSSSASPNEKKASSALCELLSATRYVKDTSGVLTNMFERLEHEILHKEEGYIYNLQMLTSLILTEFVRLTKMNAKPLFPSEDVKYRGLMITKLERFFSWRYHQHNIRIDDLAADINLSPRHTARILKQIYGMTFSEKLSEVRLQHAAQKLVSSNEKIEQISTDCGFNNVAYFYTCFKKMRGMRPSEFRQKNIAAKENS